MIIVFFIALFIIISQNSSSQKSSSSISEISTSDALAVSTQSKEELEKVRIEQLNIKNKNFRINWTDYIIAERSSFTYNDLGGIYNLSIYLTNKTEYTLDQVQVAVDYIKAAGGIYKTEFVVFENVKPEIKMVLPAPNSERGTKVEYRIYNIYAPSFHFCYDESNPVGNGSINDPWRCVQ